MAFRDPAPIKLTEVKKEVVRLDDDKQNKNSTNLTTTAKTIEGAINELKTKSDTLTSNSALKSTQIIAGNGLQGGGTLEQNRTLSIKGANDSITASSSGLAVNTYNGVNSTSTTRPASANALKTTYDKLVTVESTANSKLSKAGDTMSGNISFSNQGTTFVGLKGSVGDDDGWRIAGGSTAGNVGELEIATGFSGNQPIYVRQYNGTNYSTIARTLTLLDASGNTTFPGTLTASKISGALTGNASTATSLQTARTINGTSFNGTANITTVNWGTARTLTVGNTGKSVNGSANISWSLSEIGAFGKQGEVTSSTDWNNLRTPGVYKVQMSSWGDVSLGAPNNVFSSLYSYGILHVYQSNVSSEERTTQIYYPHSSTNSHPIVTRMYNGSTWNAWAKLGKGLTYTDVGAASSSHTHSYLPLAGGTMTGNIKYTLYSSTQTPLEVYGGDANGQGIKIGAGGSTIISSGEGKDQIAPNIAATTETMAIGSDQTIEFYTNLQNGWGGRKTMSMGANGILTNSNGFSGPLTGNSTTATTLQTARTLTIGNTGKSFNGSDNVSWSLSEIGAAASSHTHTTVGSYIGISNTTATNGYGISLYGGASAGAPSYGLMFQGTSTFGTHGAVTSDWATYFTMSGATSRGWIFKSGNSSGGNVASISATGVITASSFSGALSGNATTATTLQTARTINGTSFNGSANITTANWGTARTVTIGASSQSVNGSANYSYSHSAMQVGRAYSNSYNYGGNQNAITTAAFITILTNLGAFSQPYWCARGSWSYASNQYINDTGCGNIHLAGCTVEVMGSSSAYTVRIHTPTTSSSGVTNGDFIYVNNGSGYSPGWRRLYNTKYKPSAADVGALATSGGTISGNLTVTGAIVANGNVTAYSDRKLKSNIVKIENALDKICSIGGYTFDMLGTGQRQTGVIAQELEKVLPEAVIKNDNGYLSVDYGRVVGLLIEGIKELKEEIQELKGGK